ncbi:macro domain-containing protein [Actinoplanes sp. NPDC049599]|uniref:macro domain-containing protein n=1 Tax=Actinoplanes sp. NPDC049599 TaxID=3363903 RepID=UPI0037A1BADC
MSLRISGTDPATALRDFCGLLRDLRNEAGGPTVMSLAADKSIPLRRAHIFATLSGKIARPPSWRFVEAFVRKCATYAHAHQTTMEITTDLREWEREHKRLLRLWDRHRREQHTADSIADRLGKARGRVLTMQDITYYPVRTADAGAPRRLAVVTGDIRQVRCADVWVNSENTEMEMARVHEFSVSAIIRYEGARHDPRGRIAEDLIQHELSARVAAHRPVEPGSVVVTGPGELHRRNGVRHLLHVAAVYGEPGSGFHQMNEVSRCITNALQAAEKLETPDGDRLTVLFPLLGAGSAGGDLRRTATQLIHAARNYLSAAAATRIGTVFFLAYTDVELRACQVALRTAGLRPEP